MRFPRSTLVNPVPKHFALVRCVVLALAFCGLIIPLWAYAQAPVDVPDSSTDRIINFAQGNNLNVAERITNFSSDITINADASMEVIETIEVSAGGREIRRGILRDFPTTYRDQYGNRVRVAFDVVSVKRDGSPEPYRTESLSNGVRVRIGSASVFLPTGIHSYTITYRTDRQLGFFENFDELYWNVTGNGWTFAIDKAKAIVRLPPGAAAREQVGFTGYQGERGKDYVVSDFGDRVEFETTRRLRPREGLTVAVSWPKGFVTQPTIVDKAGYLLRDNRALLVSLAALVIVFIYYFVVWDRVGRDPEGAAVFPRFESPTGLSPAATRFIYRHGYDRKTFSAAIVSMAVKGFLIIEEQAGTYWLIRRKEADKQNLSNGEKRIAHRLFADDDSIRLESENHREIGSSIASLEMGLKNEYGRSFFIHNIASFAVGAVISVVAVIAIIATGDISGSTFILSLLLSGGIIILGVLVVSGFSGLRSSIFGHGTGIGSIFGPILMFGFACIVMVSDGAISMELLESVSWFTLVSMSRWLASTSSFIIC